LEDEPLAVPDRVVDHVERCRRCGPRLTRIAREAERSARLLGAPQLVPDVDAAWVRLQRDTRDAHWLGGEGPVRRGDPVVVPRRTPRFARISLRTGLTAGGVVIVLAGSATAATLTTVFAPTHVAPVPLSRSDISALSDFIGLGQQSTGQGQGQKLLGGFSSPSGSDTTPFGVIQWSSTGSAGVVPTVADAAQEAGFTPSLPTTLPAGVAGPAKVMVQPRIEVTVTFAPNVADIGGSSIVLDAGPAVVVTYGSAGGPGVPTLGILTMPRPVARSTGATMSQIEAFLLDQPGIPPELAQEIRLLGDLGTTLPVPVPAGTVERSVDVGGAPGVLVADSANVASGVVWEDSAGVLRVVAGLVDQQDALNVADQLR
jgi:hypothetical protein